jgi:hypothetical protein
MSLIWRFSTVPTSKARQLILKTAPFLCVPNATLIYSTLAAVGGTIVWCADKGQEYAIGFGAVFVVGTLLHNFYDAKIRWAWEECMSADTQSPSSLELDSRQPANGGSNSAPKLCSAIGVDALKTQPALVHAYCTEDLQWGQEAGLGCSPHPPIVS